MKWMQTVQAARTAGMRGRLLAGVIVAGGLALGTPPLAGAAAEPSRGEVANPGDATGHKVMQPDTRAQALVKASSLIGLRLLDGSDRPIGQIHDLAIDLDTGRINFVVASLGDFFRTAERLVAIPAEALHVNGDHAKINVTGQNINQLPSLAFKSWLTSTFDADTFNQMYRAMGLEVAQMHRNSRPIKASELLDGEVLLTRQRIDVPVVEEVALDLQSGYAPYVIVGLDGVPGIARKTIAVPTAILSRDSEGNELRLAVSTMQLERAPAIGTDWTHSLARRSAGERIYAAYGATPYWARDGRPAEAIGGANESESSDVLERRGR